MPVELEDRLRRYGAQLEEAADAPVPAEEKGASRTSQHPFGVRRRTSRAELAGPGLVGLAAVLMTTVLLIASLLTKSGDDIELHALHPGTSMAPPATAPASVPPSSSATSPPVAASLPDDDLAPASAAPEAQVSPAELPARGELAPSAATTPATPASPEQGSPPPGAVEAPTTTGVAPAPAAGFGTLAGRIAWPAQGCPVELPRAPAGAGFALSPCPPLQPLTVVMIFPAGVAGGLSPEAMTATAPPVASVGISGDGRFELELPAGRYAVSVLVAGVHLGICSQANACEVDVVAGGRSSYELVVGAWRN